MDSDKPTKDEEWTEEISAERAKDERALVRRIDILLMPMLWVMYVFSYVDRTNIGNAKVAGMMDDLGVSSTEYSMVLVIFFISYVVFEIPSNLILVRTQPSVFIPTIMVLWGGITMCMAAVGSYGSLLGVRFVLGMVEAGFAPGVMFLLSSWYRPVEQAKRFSIFYSAAVLSGAFGGIVAGAITGSLDGVRGLRGWQWLFLVEGAATVACAIIAYFVLPDFPANTKRFSPRERELAVQRLKADNVSGRTDDETPLTSLKALRASLTDWRTWILTLGYTGSNGAMGGSTTMSYFYPTLVAGLGYTATMAQYMVVPIYAVAFVAVLTTGYFSDKYPTVRGLIVASWLALSMACSIVVCAVYDFKARYVLLVFMATGLLSGNALSLAYASSTFAPQRPETRAVSIAFLNGLANLAQIYGAYLFPDGDAPKYIMGFAVISGLCAVCVVVYSAAHLLIRRYPGNRA